MLGPFTRAALILAPVYLFYLAIFTRVTIWHDSIGYERLATFLANGQWINYVSPAISREPFYPTLIAAAMGIAKFLDVPYISIVLILQVFALLGVLGLMAHIMRRLHIRDTWQALILLYTAVSPALVNFTMVLWSDFLPAGLILTGVVVYAGCLKLLRQADAPVSLLARRGLALGFLLAVLCLLKAVFELAGLLLIASIPLVFLAARHGGNVRNLAILGLACLLAFQIPLNAYKAMNWHFNGHYAITDRGPWALYGSAAQRSKPMTAAHWAAAVAVVPHADVCRMLLPETLCREWGDDQSSTQPGFAKMHELYARMPQPEADKTMVRLSLELMAQHPMQTAALAFLSGAKLLFWEYYTPTAYAVYPPWVRAVYSHLGLMLALRALVSVLTVAAVIWVATRLFRRPAGRRWALLLEEDRYRLLLAMAVWAICYILPYSLFFMFGRYALALAPIYLIWIGAMLNSLRKS